MLLSLSEGVDRANSVEVVTGVGDDDESELVVARWRAGERCQAQIRAVVDEICEPRVLCQVYLPAGRPDT